MSSSLCIQRWIIVSLLIWSGAVFASTADPDFDPGIAVLEERLGEAFARSSLRGASVAVVADGQVELFTYGVGDPAGESLIQPDTRFRAGSVSKLITSLLVLRAEAAGLLSLDDLVAEWLPGVLQPPAEGAEAVRIAHLLEHTAGLAGSSYAEYAAQTPDMTPSEYIERNSPFDLRWAPGVHYSYANAGHTLAARIVEIAWGADFDTLVRREVFRPLGMRDSSFDNASDAASLSRSFLPDGGAASRWAMPVRPAGALISTPADLARVVSMLLARGSGPGGRRFLPEVSIKRMERGEHSLAAKAGAGAGVYALGNFPFVAGGRLYRGHWGRTEGFQATLGYRPADESGFVLLVNTSDRAGVSLMRELLGQSLGSGADPDTVSEAPGGELPFSTDGVFVNHSHDMPLRSWLFGLLQAHTIESTADGVKTRSPWPWNGTTREWQRVGEALYRAEGLAVPTATLAETAEGIFWVDGESYRRVPAAGFYLQWLGIGLGLLASVAAVLRFVKDRCVDLFSTSIPKPWLPSALLAISGAGYLYLFYGFARFGLYGEAGTLGQINPASLSLMLVSVVSPFLALVVFLRQSTAGTGRWTAGVLCLLGLQLAFYGWLPLLTWRS